MTQVYEQGEKPDKGDVIIVSNYIVHQLINKNIKYLIKVSIDKYKCHLLNKRSSYYKRNPKHVN